MNSVIDDAILERHGVTRDEYARIVELMGREPNLTELGLFSVMWSEHCSYKSSRVHLKTLPTTGTRVLQGPGENAGAVDIGDGLAAVFKIESHNHPSFIEPYQGAATGVGGIIRDIFTMGARPIALLNALRFGSIEEPRTRRIIQGVVRGIGGYGNSIGIPTVGGEVMFDETYSGNPLVNVFCLGLARHDAIIKGTASGVGNPVYYVGAKTGRDGIHGATMASAEFDDKLEEKRPAVQVGDPFMEKLLLEACLEVMATDACVGVQDMGAAGLTCATSETGSRGGTGVEIDVALVPQRETGMTRTRSCSRNRRSACCSSSRRAASTKSSGSSRSGICTRSRSASSPTTTGCASSTTASSSPTCRTARSPTRRRSTGGRFSPPAGREELRTMPASLVSTALKPNATLLTLLGSATIASKRWIFQQYDYTVQTNTIMLPGMGASVVRVKGTDRALAMSVDGNGRFVFLDPRQGAKLAVAEAARNVACAGGLPIGATNCLNFGNPQKPEIMWQFAEAVAGIGEACRALDVPITGGNVSLYNETDGSAVLPTPVIGVVGVLEHAKQVRGRAFPQGGADVVLLGDNLGELGGSEYLKTMHGLVRGVPPALDLARERALQTLLVDLIGRDAIASAHDCSEGGFAVTLAECCFNTGGRGVDVTIPAATGDGGVDLTTATLFGESASRVIVAVEPGKTASVLAAAQAAGVPAAAIGRTGGARIRITIGDHEAIDVSVSDAEARWTTALANWLEGRAA